MKKRAHHDVYDAAGRAIGYVRRWNGKWRAIHRIGDDEYRCGTYADRTQAIVAVLQADVPPAQQPEQPPMRTLH
jgi:hypothetical protein